MNNIGHAYIDLIKMSVYDIKLSKRKIIALISIKRKT